MIKLFAADLDGTLLNAAHTVDHVILSAIREVRREGAHFSIATGRVMRSNCEAGFEGNVAVISANGALVLDENGQLVHEVLMDVDFVEELARAFPEAPFEFVCTKCSCHACSFEEHVASYGATGLRQKVLLRGMKKASGEHVYNCGVGEICAAGVCKINCRVTDSMLASEISACITEHANVAHDAPFSPEIFEITDPAATKGAAVAWLASTLGIAEEEVAVYGDGGNDIEMLSRFEHAYATRGACEDAKRVVGSERTIGSCAFHAVPRHMRKTLRGERG